MSRKPKRQRARQTAIPRTVSGRVIDRATVEARSGASEDQINRWIGAGLMPGPERTSRPGVPGAAWNWREGHADYATHIREVLEAGGRYEDAALRLLLLGMPCPNTKWTRRALLVYAKRMIADGTPPLTSGTRTPQQVTAWATRRNVPAVPARLFTGALSPQDPKLPDLSLHNIREHIERASDDAIQRVYQAAQKIMISHKDNLGILVRTVLPNAKTEAEIVATFTPNVTIAQGITSGRALVPLFMIALLLQPSADAMRASFLAVGLSEPACALEHRHAADMMAPVWTVEGSLAADGHPLALPSPKPLDPLPNPAPVVSP